MNAWTVFGSVSASQALAEPCRASPEDHRERPEQHDQQVAERDEPETDAYARSCLVAQQRMPPIESSNTNEIASSTTATAAAPAWSPLWMWLKT